jgi:hypothetical protein
MPIAGVFYFCGISKMCNKWVYNKASKKGIFQDMLIE